MTMKVLIADDDTNLRKVLRTELAEEGFDVRDVADGLQAIAVLQKEEYDVLLLDLNMPKLGGMEVLKRIASLGLPLEVVVLTGHAAVPTAIEAMKLSAYDYISKPFKIEELVAVLQKAYEKKRLREENSLLKSRIQRQSAAPPMITRSPVILEVLENARRIALSELPVLIQGESGVGKELVARAIHQAGQRSEGPFIPLNCGALPEHVLESELFGHEKGSFTGAHARKPGLLEIAHQGTLFLDEVGETIGALQSKLLRVIETGKFFRVGGTREVAVDVKFISATNKDLRHEVKKGFFRADLYYRISAVVLCIPSLRERREDIPLLMEYFLKNHPLGRSKQFGKSALEALEEYSWPGNVRELQNVIYRTLLLAKGEKIEAEDLPLDLVKERRERSRRLEEVEREHILGILKEAGGHKGKAAEILGVDPKTLYRKLLSYGTGSEPPPRSGRGNWPSPGKTSSA